MIIMVNKIIWGLKFIKIRDLFAPFIFLVLLPASIIYKLYLKIFKKEIWIVSEAKTTARDNGFHFYKYIREKHNNINCYYVMDKHCKDYNKVKKYGNIIQFGSLKHWLYYMSAKYIISNQKGDNPNTIFWYFMHVVLGLFKKRIFLQHGILLNDCKWLYYKETKFKLFICGAKDEYNDVLKRYGYPTKNVVYTGLARFDNLHNKKSDVKRVLIMPTWRNWLGKDFNKLNKVTNFKDTIYYKKWYSLLNNKKLINYIEKNNVIIEFYPHINMQKYLNNFNVKTPNIRILDTSYDIQETLIRNSLMITDYSSVSVDFAYMRKPIIYYQFDEKEFRQKQYTEGYFNYRNNGFGDVCSQEEETVNKIIYYISNKYKIEKKYKDRMINFYELYDDNNCKRIYEAILDLDRENL